MATLYARGMSNIEILRVDFPRLHGRGEGIVALLTGLPRLRRLSLPTYGITGRLLFVLATATNIEEVVIDNNVPACDSWLPHPDILDNFILPPYCNSVPFLHLRKLSMALPSLGVMTELVRRRYFSSGTVVDLLLRLPFVEEDRPASFQRMMIALSDAMKSLKRLELWMLPGRTQRGCDVQRASPLCFQHILPITLFQHLEHVAIHDVVASRLSDADVTEFGIRMPSLRLLHLNPHPYSNAGVVTTFGVLPSLARHCPRLCDLALCLDGAQPFSLTDVAEFRWLSHLRLGRSLIPPSDSSDARVDLARLIARVAPTDFTYISCGIPMTLDCIDEGVIRGSRVFPLCVSPEWVGVFDRLWAGMDELIRVCREERQYERAAAARVARLKGMLARTSV